MGVIRGAHEMKGHIGFIADDPAIMPRRPWWDVKEVTGAEFVDRAVFHRSRCTAGKHQPNMLDVAARCTQVSSDMDRPLPPRLVGGAADGHVADANDFEFSVLESPNFVRLFKSF